VGLHALLGGDDVAAEAVARGGLLTLKVVQSLRCGNGAAVYIGVLLFDFLRLSGCFRLRLRSVAARTRGDDVPRLGSRLRILPGFCRTGFLRWRSRSAASAGSSCGSSG